VTRDIDLFRELARFDAVRVYVSVTSLDPALQRVMEPRTAAPSRRLAAVRELARAGVPVGVMVAPVIPGLNDHEIPSIVDAAAASGARTARHLMLRLPHGLAPLFEEWLERHFPDRKDKVIRRIRDMRGGKMSSARFHDRMQAGGFFASQTHALFDLACRRAGLDPEQPEPSTASFRAPGGDQLALFS
jgi:DNA repair photolyase